MTTARPTPRLYRTRSGSGLAGVARGIAHHLNVPPLAVRLAFVVLTWVSGLGVLLYAAFWAMLPVEPAQPDSAPPKRDTGQLMALVALGGGIQIVAVMAGWSGPRAAIGWLIAVVALGAGIIWHQADATRRQQFSQSLPRVPWLASYLESSGRPATLVRIAAGGILVVVGLIGAVAVTSSVGGGDVMAVLNGVLFAVIAVAGLALVLGPFIWRIITQLRDEGLARVREQERAEVAAMVHDQVLHTLAMIQRNVTDPKEVARLARGQERMLRNWLYKQSGSADEELAAAVEAVAAEVEDTFAISVDAVIVGDLFVDPRVAALVGAAREALVNAARHAKVETVSLYVEVEPDQIRVYVRDRGVGFDPSAVDEDRHGIRGSIEGRMTRHGGSAQIVSTPGDGTEVRLSLPRTPGASS